MSVRRKTANRLTLFRECDICGQQIVTTADTPWMRQVYIMDGNTRRQVTRYYCSSSCFQASYKHVGWYDGKAEDRRHERSLNRDPKKRAEQWKRYYAANGDKVRERRMKRYWENHEEELADNRYQKKKRKLLQQEEAKVDA